MITLTEQLLTNVWPDLSGGMVVKITLSSWDGGDALTDATFAPLGSAERIEGIVRMAGTAESRAGVEVVLSETKEQTPDMSQDSWLAPNGTHYTLTGLVNGGSDVTLQVVDVDHSLQERRSGLLETHLLKESNVVVAGLGTGGIAVAIELAKLGVGKFTLIDHDRLSVGNVSRHHAGLSQVGRKKVLVARDLILEKNPSAKIRALPLRIEDGTEEEVRDEIRRADVVICATDGRPSKLFVNRLCWEEQVPVIIGGAYRRAYGGQVLLVRPPTPPCFQCFVQLMPDEATDTEIASASDASSVAYSDRPVPIEPGLALDIAPMALMVSKLALHLLLIGKKTTLPSLDQDFSSPWFFWLNRPEPGTPHADLPPLSESIDEITILRWYGVEFDGDPACPVCGDFERAVLETLGETGTTSRSFPELDDVRERNC